MNKPSRSVGPRLKPPAPRRARAREGLGKVVRSVFDYTEASDVYHVTMATGLRPQWIGLAQEDLVHATLDTTFLIPMTALVAMEWGQPDTQVGWWVHTLRGPNHTSSCSFLAECPGQGEHLDLTAEMLADVICHLSTEGGAV